MKLQDIRFQNQFQIKKFLYILADVKDVATSMTFMSR